MLQITCDVGPPDLGVLWCTPSLWRVASGMWALNGIQNGKPKYFYFTRGSRSPRVSSNNRIFRCFKMKIFTGLVLARTSCTRILLALAYVLVGCLLSKYHALGLVYHRLVSIGVSLQRSLDRRVVPCQALFVTSSTVTCVSSRPAFCDSKCLNFIAFSPLASNSGC